MSKSEPWSDCFGQPAADMRMAEIHLRRAVRRARRTAEQGVPPSSIYADAARIRDRAAEQTELARQISQALHVCEGRAGTPQYGRVLDFCAEGGVW
jgi:hypothetical protein